MLHRLLSSKYICLSFLFLGYLIPGHTQSNQIKGSVTNRQLPLEFVNVALLNTPHGSTTNEKGEFSMEDLETGEYTLSISMVGYKSYQQNIKLGQNEVLNLGEISLTEDILGLTEVVVTGNMKETFVTDSPVKVDVITNRFLEKNIAPTNLVEGVAMVNGVEEVVACGVCYTNNISINGLPGAYTAILMDGTPIYGNLASVYGLNGIPTTIIDRFEVIKGPSSTLYGSEAVAGVINIITKDPSEQSLVEFDLMATSHLESFGSLTISPKLKKWNSFIGVDYAYINKYEDENGDNFGDFINLDRVSLFTKWSLKRESGRRFNLFGKYYYEDRRNGVEDFLRDRAYKSLRGSDSIYGESIYTRRGELFGTYEFDAIENIKLDFSLSHHDQNSFYGSDFYKANQSIAFANLTWDKTLGNHNFILGLTSRFQSYDDNTVATEKIEGENILNAPDQQFIPGIFLQDQWEVSKKLVFLGGVRLDHYSAHGLITAPRLNIKYNPGTWTTFRLNFGTGFRIVNLFTEDHAFITGQREIEIQEDLLPERSYNAALNFNHIYTLGNSQGTIDLNAHYTYFTNKIIPDYSDPSKIIYTNSDGYAQTKGLGINLIHQFTFPLSFNFGVNFQDVSQTEEDEQGILQTSPIEFASEWTGVGTINYQIKKANIDFSYTINLNGPMALPEVFDLDENGQPLSYSRPTRSEAFSFQNLQINKYLPRTKMTVYIGIQNLLDYRQPFSPLVGFNDPNAAIGFSGSFDTAYAYGPIHGREFYIGWKWKY